MKPDRRKTRVRSDVQPGMLSIRVEGWFIPYRATLTPYGQFEWALIEDGQRAALCGVVTVDMFGITGNLENGGTNV